MPIPTLADCKLDFEWLWNSCKFNSWSPQTSHVAIAGFPPPLNPVALWVDLASVAIPAAPLPSFSGEIPGNLLPQGERQEWLSMALVLLKPERMDFINRFWSISLFLDRECLFSTGVWCLWLWRHAGLN